jgi:hypothetical protein
MLVEQWNRQVDTLRNYRPALSLRTVDKSDDSKAQNGTPLTHQSKPPSSNFALPSRMISMIALVHDQFVY